MMRWIASNSKGKSGEVLYPGKKSPEQAWDIDQLVETSDDFLGADFGPYMAGAPIPEETTLEAVAGPWTKLLTMIEK